MRLNGLLIKSPFQMFLLRKMPHTVFKSWAGALEGLEALSYMRHQAWPKCFLLVSAWRIYYFHIMRHIV